METAPIEVFVDGSTIDSKEAFFQAFVALEGVPDWVGHNLDALWDTLTGLIEAPMVLNWAHSEESARAMGPDFEEIVSTMRQAETERPDGWFKLQLLSGKN